jgi:hypothetical protein
VIPDLDLNDALDIVIVDRLERSAIGDYEAPLPASAVLHFARAILSPIGPDLPRIVLDLSPTNGLEAAGYYDRPTATVHLLPEACLPSVIAHELAHHLAPELGHGTAFLRALRTIYRAGGWHFNLSSFDARARDMGMEI